MAKLTRDTAKRSIDKLFAALPIDAVIEMTTIGSTPPAGMAAAVKIEITSPSLRNDPPRRRIAPKSSSQPKPDEGQKGTPDADVSGQPGPAVGSRLKRKRPKTGPGNA